MVRPCKKRNIHMEPQFTCFKPAGIPRKKLEKIDLMIDEYESIRLSDYLGLSNIDGALKMGISPPTFNRLVTKARKKLIQTIVEGKGLRIYNNNGTHDCE